MWFVRFALLLIRWFGLWFDNLCISDLVLIGCCTEFECLCYIG